MRMKKILMIMLMIVLKVKGPKPSLIGMMEKKFHMGN
jgi:hypothetical protein